MKSKQAETIQKAIYLDTRKSASKLISITNFMLLALKCSIKLTEMPSVMTARRCDIE